LIVVPEPIACETRTVSVCPSEFDTLRRMSIVIERTAALVPFVAVPEMWTSHFCRPVEDNPSSFELRSVISAVTRPDGQVTRAATACDAGPSPPPEPVDGIDEALALTAPTPDETDGDGDAVCGGNVTNASNAKSSRGSGVDEAL
jgi:hypothetical protein